MKRFRFSLQFLLPILCAGCVANGTLVQPQASLSTPDSILESRSGAATPLSMPATERRQDGSSEQTKPTHETLLATFTAGSIASGAIPVPTSTTISTPENNSVLEGTQPCQRPPDDTSRVNFKDTALNARTLWMLHLASNIYRGRGDPLRVTQGSYSEAEDLSFGTHSGGGAVDISIRVKSDPSQVLSIKEAGEMVRVLRFAGFAAWLRLPDDLTPSVPLHIHAVAVGDPSLSPAALQQLIGPEGYFRGLDGVPPEFGGPHQDRYGGPVLCDWMIEMGFIDLR